MNLNDLIVIIPELLLLFIPGYISIRIKEKYSIEKRSDNFDITLYSILCSFIIGIVYSAIEDICVSACEKSIAFFEIDTIKQAIYLVLAVLFGFFLVKIRRT